MNSFPLVVALTGQAGAGKSTAASYLVERHGYVLVKFAGPLKAMMRALGLSHAHIEGHLKEVPCALLGGKTPRYAMQTLGTEWGRNLLGDDFWVNAWREIASDVLDQGGRVVVDDCRFANEGRAVRALGGVVLELRGRGGISGAHSSESSRPEPDAILNNVGTHADLHAALDRLPAFIDESKRSFLHAIAV